jgi:hypothetical protein
MTSDVELIIQHSYVQDDMSRVSYSTTIIDTTTSVHQLSFLSGMTSDVELVIQHSYVQDDMSRVPTKVKQADLSFDEFATSFSDFAAALRKPLRPLTYKPRNSRTE